MSSCSAYNLLRALVCPRADAALYLKYGSYFDPTSRGRTCEVLASAHRAPTRHTHATAGTYRAAAAQFVVASNSLGWEGASFPPRRPECYDLVNQHRVQSGNSYATCAEQHPSSLGLQVGSGALGYSANCTNMVCCRHERG